MIHRQQFLTHDDRSVGHGNSRKWKAGAGKLPLKTSFASDCTLEGEQRLLEPESKVSTAFPGAPTEDAGAQIGCLILASAACVVLRVESFFYDEMAVDHAGITNNLLSAAPFTVFKCSRVFSSLDI